MRSIALITYDGLPELSQSDQLLVGQLQKEGFEIQILPWNKNHVNWNIFDAVVLRSCWDYHTKVDEFTRWLDDLEYNNVPVWNPLPILRWNMDKKYLHELAEKGIPTIPTVWVKRTLPQDLQQIQSDTAWESMVIKPTIGASAYGVFLINGNDTKTRQKEYVKLLKKTDVMVQPYIPEIQSKGELSVIFIGGQYSHTVQKIPPPEEFRINYKYRATERIIELSKEILDQVTTIYNTVETPLLYARVDGIIVNGKFLLMELELVEPHLFFDLHPQAVMKFATALKKIVEQKILRV